MHHSVEKNWITLNEFEWPRVWAHSISMVRKIPMMYNLCLSWEILTHVEEIRWKWSRSDHESDLKVTICLICHQFAIFYLLNKARIEIRLIWSKSRIFELTPDDLEYNLNRLVCSRRVQRCIIYASTTSETYSSTFGVVQLDF